MSHELERDNRIIKLDTMGNENFIGGKVDIRWWEGYPRNIHAVNLFRVVRWR